MAIDRLRAVEVAEGTVEPRDEAEVVEAWQYLHDTDPDAGIGDKVFVLSDAAGVALSTTNARTFAANILAAADAVDAKIASDVARLSAA